VGRRHGKSLAWLNVKGYASPRAIAAAMVRAASLDSQDERLNAQLRYIRIGDSIDCKRKGKGGQRHYCVSLNKPPRLELDQHFLPKV